MDPGVLVVVVTHESADLIEGFATALRRELDDAADVEMVLVDNASTDGTPDVVRGQLGGATVLEPGANLGYGAAINVAVRHTRPRESILVLNPDVTLQPGCLRRLRTALRVGVGIAVPRLLERDGTIARSQRREPTVLRAAGESLLGGLRAGRVAALGEIVCDASAYARPGRTDWATGAAWLIDVECYERVGGFEEGYFLYSEETDFALRARDLGYSTEFVPDAVATHAGGASNVDPALFALLTRNRVWCYRRRHTAASALAFRTALFAGELARASGGRATSRAAVRALLGDQRVLPAPARRAGYGTRRIADHRARGRVAMTNSRP
jgi:N-acetylglucosaminyl-diphospho-decaprenol L-rhamnosyltransferase